MAAIVPIELKLLMAAVIIGLVQIVWAAAAGSGGERNLPGCRARATSPSRSASWPARLDRALAQLPARPSRCSPPRC